MDRALIGTTRYENNRTRTIDFARISSRDEASDTEKVIFRTKPGHERHKIIYQIGTASPELAVQAAKIVAADVAGIDVNAGCPKPFSTKGGMGAALLRTPDTLCAILRALVEEVGRPYEIGISVKIRVLEQPDMTADLVRQLCRTGITGLTVHCRMPATRKTERAMRDQLKMVADICRAHGVASLMNGDVPNRDEALRLIQEYGVDGAMIATSANLNPSCFRGQADGGLVDWRTVADEYVRTALEVSNHFPNTKYTLLCILPGKAGLHRQVTTCRDYKTLCGLMELRDLIGLSEAVDETQVRKARGKRKGPEAEPVGTTTDDNVLTGQHKRLKPLPRKAEISA